MIDKTKFQKTVVAPLTGQEFLVRRVRLKEFVADLGMLPLATNGTVQDIIKGLSSKAEAGDVGTEERITRFYAERGVISPKIWFGDETACPDDQLFYLDLGSDLDLLVQEIIAYSNTPQRLERLFREPVAADIGLNGAEVRSEAVEPVAEGAVKE
jgi:hypothetical protein